MRDKQKAQNIYISYIYIWINCAIDKNNNNDDRNDCFFSKTLPAFFAHFYSTIIFVHRSSTNNHNNNSQFSNSSNSQNNDDRNEAKIENNTCRSIIFCIIFPKNVCHSQKMKFIFCFGLQRSVLYAIKL